MNRIFAARSHMRPLVLLCLAGSLAWAASSGRFVKLTFNLNPDPDGMSFKDGAETWYEYPVLCRWLSESELREGRIELGTLVVAKKLYVGGEFSLPPIEFDRARLDASAWEEMTPQDAGSAEPGWANDSLEGKPYLARWYRYKKPVVLEWDRKLYLTVTSEPPGARAYVAGRLVGAVPATGLTFSYPLRSSDYRRGYVLGDSFTLVRYGYLPKSFQYRFGLDPAKDQSQSDIQRFDSFRLERDLSVAALSLMPPAYAQPSGPRYDADKARKYDGALAECEQALVEWEAAMRGCSQLGLDSKAIDKSAATAPGTTLGSEAKDAAAARLRAARIAVDRLMERVRSLETK
ncbi:hypothetical protein FJY68_00020 [candidate division WOR-3 bacterium]|uniref:Uncharacterized protein n=1 Tax=candidate division WOR-3 bacterium TaxID=2052148 RepID=A0A937XEM1_UNCW3|nr:hypothetical protein [candidate division WOR-3 bacterium]